MQPLLHQFLGIEPGSVDPGRARYAILPVPYEGTVSYMGGTGGGPAAILAASTHVEEFDEELARDFRDAGVFTLTPVPPAASPEEQMGRIASTAASVLRRGKFVLALGGEHSITAPLVRAAADRHGEISVLQIDAHADLRDTYDGSRHSHACVMRRVLEVTSRLCQVGIRSFSQDECRQCPELVSRFITPAMVEDDPSWIAQALGLLSDKVYITIDVDGFDPSSVPGTGTPEPGGLTWRQVTALLRRVCATRAVVGADIVEVAPIPGQRVSEFLAARLAYKIIGYIESSASSEE